MALRIGVIGAGNIGQDHIRRLTQVLRGAEVVALADVDAARAEAVAGRVPGARALGSGEEVVRADDVQAVVVTTTGPTHEPFVLAAVESGKPVFCEKPLAATAAACRRILDAEAAGGRRLVQVGFMRRFDPGYRAMKAAIDAGRIGRPLMVRCVHRNASAPPNVTSESIIYDSAVHEIDVARWLLGEEIAAARVLLPRATSKVGPALRDPQIVVLETASGAMVLDELFVNCGYGYDVRCEVVGETGTVALGDGGDVVLHAEGRRSAGVAPDWRERFERAYDVELQAWIEAAADGGATGPTAWDGYAAAEVTDACVEALHTGDRTAVSLIERPPFYQDAR